MSFSRISTFPLPQLTILYRKFTASNLPGVVRPQVNEIIEIDVDAVVKSVQQVIAKI